MIDRTDTAPSPQSIDADKPAWKRKVERYAQSGLLPRRLYLSDETMTEIQSAGSPAQYDEAIRLGLRALKILQKKS